MKLGRCQKNKENIILVLKVDQACCIGTKRWCGLESEDAETPLRAPSISHARAACPCEFEAVDDKKENIPENVSESSAVNYRTRALVLCWGVRRLR